MATLFILGQSKDTVRQIRTVCQLHGSVAGNTDLRVVECAALSSFFDAQPWEGPACIVTSLNLPGGNGLDLLEQIQTYQGRLQSVVLTGELDVPSAHVALKRGAASVLVHPVHDAELFFAMQAAFVHAESMRMVLERAKTVMDKVKTLDPMERRVWKGIASGQTNRQIAQDLSMGLRTVEQRRQQLLQKLRINTLVDLIRFTVEFEQLQQRTESPWKAS